MSEGVFVSYRRDDAPGHAGRLYDSLATRFGADRVFMDVDSIEPGVDFVELIERTLANSAVVVVVIGPNWLHARDAHGADRLGEADDFVHLEVRRALELDKRVIPVLVDGATAPAPAELPADLAVLARRNAFDVSDARFHSDAARLADAIEKLLAPSPIEVVPAVESEQVPRERVAPPVEPDDTRPPERDGRHLMVGKVRRRRWVVPAVIAGVVLLIVLIAVIVSSGGGGGGTNEADTTGVATEVTEGDTAASNDTTAGTSEVAPAVPSVTGSIATGSHPAEVEVVDDALWVQVDGGLERYDATADNPTPTKTIDLGANGNDIIPGDGVLYVTLYQAQEVAVVDLTTNEVDRIAVGGAPLAGALVGDTLWLTVHGDFDGEPAALVPIADGHSGTPLPLAERPFGLVAYDNALWVTLAENGSIARVDPSTGETTPYPVGPGPVDVQAINDTLWVTVSGANEVVLVDPSSGDVTDHISVGTRPWKLADGFDLVWVSNRGDDAGPGSVSRIDPSSLEVTGEVPTEVSTDELAIGPSAVFAVNYGSNTVSVISPGVSS